MVSMDSLYLKTYKKMFYLCLYHVYNQRYDKNNFFHVSVAAILDLSVYELTVENTAGQTL